MRVSKYLFDALPAKNYKNTKIPGGGGGHTPFRVYEYRVPPESPQMLLNIFTETYLMEQFSSEFRVVWL